MQVLRDLWETSLNEAKVVSETVGISPEFVIKRTPNANEKAPERNVQLETSNEFKSSG